VEELAKAVSEPGASAEAAEIPGTLADSLMARLDRLASGKELAQQAAVLGREFSYGLFARIAGLPDDVLRSGLGRLVEAEILFARGEPPASTYTFKHALVREAAYESLLRRTRQELHGRVVDALTTELAERADAEPEVVARHAEAAGRIDQAVEWYRRAGERAQERSYGEAILQLRHAIELVAAQPETEERDVLELPLQLALGASLTATRGYAHADTVTAYERSLTLGRRGHDPRHVIAQSALALSYAARGEVERGRLLGMEALASAEQLGDPEMTIYALENALAPEYFQGRFHSALQHAEQALTFYDPARHTGAMFRTIELGCAATPLAACCLLRLGLVGTALTRVEEAVALARRIEHPYTLAYTLQFESSIHWDRRDPARLRDRACELIALSETQAFPYWLGLGHAWHGAARVMEGDAAALTEIFDGLALAAGTGTRLGAPGLLAVVARAQRTAGRLEDAQGSVASGLTLSAQTGQHYVDADLHRLDGELLLAHGAAPAAIAERYQRALAIARAQAARLFELRAATSLARLWHSEGRSAEARALLAPVYEWFTEGHDTLDLIEAKTLLEQLGG
jgi:predicted ATPase